MFLKTKTWIKKQRNHQFNTIGRMSILSPDDTERFYKTLYQTYKEAAIALGLIEDDEQMYKNLMKHAR